MSTLREGGNVLVIRHATADAEINRQELLRSCLLQRNLTEAGREQATEIGGRSGRCVSRSATSAAARCAGPATQRAWPSAT